MNEDIPVLDIREALNRSMGDVSFLKMMLEELHRTVPDYVKRIRNALVARDMQALGSDAHQFKGAAANLGAKAMAQIAFQLEEIGKHGTIENANEAMGQLDQAIDAFNQCFEQIDWEAVSAE